MRAMILAAGKGERMGELTKRTPKPLLKLAGQYLIDYPLQNLKRAGIKEVVINIAYHAEMIKSALGDERFGIRIAYSEEEKRLETGGGIVKALSLLGDAPFLVMSSDIITDFPLESLPREPKGLGHLVMVDNPPYHLRGDFGLSNGLLDLQSKPTFTFGNIAVYRPELFLSRDPVFFRLNELLLPAISNHQITGEHYQGMWFNVGTPSDLVLANAEVGCLN